MRANRSSTQRDAAYLRRQPVPTIREIDENGEECGTLIPENAHVYGDVVDGLDGSEGGGKFSEFASSLFNPQCEWIFIRFRRGLAITATEFRHAGAIGNHQRWYEPDETGPGTVFWAADWKPFWYVWF